jgi:cyclophilin family peptidyl-prolyl cis-trans isomerase
MSVMSKQIKKLLITTAIATIAGFTNTASATIVQIQTSYGNIEVNLFDKETPKTVENFLAYIDDNAYDNSIIHRSISGFITQGGGFYFNSENVLTDITERAAVINEPIYSNLRGTIAMAKLGGNPNSATSQWFINLTDNSLNLDNQNSGFTVFGQVTEAGMAVMDTIAAVSTGNKGGAYTDIPLEDTSIGITPDNTVVVDTIAIIDSTVNSASDMEPVLTSRQATKSTSSGSGHLGYLWVTLFSLLGLARIKKHFNQ